MRTRGMVSKKDVATSRTVDRIRIKYSVIALSLSVFFASVPYAGAADDAFDCIINPSLTLKLGSPTASILDMVTVERGDHVKKDEVVAQLESKVEEAAVALDQARAQSSAEIESKQAILEQRQGVLDRKTALQRRGDGASQDVDTALADFRVAEQDVALAKLNRQLAELELRRSQAALEQRTIRSPIDGIVVQRQLGPGEYVRQDAYIVSVARIDPLNVEAFLPVGYFGQVKVGDTAIVRPDEPVGGDRKAEVKVVDQLSDAASGTFGVRLELPNPDDAMPAGFRCRVKFDLSRHPEQASAPGVVLAR